VYDGTDRLPSTSSGIRIRIRTTTHPMCRRRVNRGGDLMVITCYNNCNDIKEAASHGRSSWACYRAPDEFNA
jgi:hypothetical protein